MLADAKELTDGGEFSDMPLPDPAPPTGASGPQAPADRAASQPAGAPATDSHSSSRSARTDAAAALADPAGAEGAAAGHGGPSSWTGQGKGTTDPIAALAAALAEWTAHPITDKHPDPEEEAVLGGAAFLRAPQPSAAPASEAGGVPPDGSYLGLLAEPAESAPGVLQMLSGTAGADNGQLSADRETQGEGGGPPGKTADGVKVKGARPESRGGEFYTDEVAMDVGGADGAPAADVVREHHKAEDGPPTSAAATEGPTGGPSDGKQVEAAHAEPRTGDFYTDEVAMDVGAADGAPAADAEREHHGVENGLSRGASAIAQARPSLLAAP